MLTQFLYKCRDYVRGIVLKNMVQVDRMDPATATLLHCLGGRDEYVRTKAHTYVWETRIEDLVNVSCLGLRKAAFRPLYPGQPYTRRDLRLETRQVGSTFVFGAVEVRLGVWIIMYAQC